ncbi:MAG: CHAT domain-containing protein [Acidobacteriota bacterium]|nr:CHAT domain-containing protein [Acidobacteriota bacterium]
MGEEIARDLVGLGQDLYHQLFPRELQTIYRSVRDQVRTLLVVSDEPWIHWEMVHPPDEGDSFLCLRHVFGRWLAGERPLAPDRQIENLLFIQGGDDEQLQGTGSERQFLEDFAQEIDGLHFSPATAQDSSQLIDLLQSQSFDLLHFAGHGQHDPKRPSEAKILLFDGSFRARQLTSSVQAKLEKNRPLVVFNACQVGQIGQSLTELDGWAHRWIQRCGCSAFLAPAWSVGDQSALAFIKAFYSSLQAGQLLGEAVLQARRTLHEKDPGNLAWLAYRLYGSLNAQIVLGSLPRQPELAAEKVAQSAPERVVGSPPTASAQLPEPARPPDAPPKPQRSPGDTSRPSPARAMWRRPPILIAAWAIVLLGAVVVYLSVQPDDWDPGSIQQGPVSEEASDPVDEATEKQPTPNESASSPELPNASEQPQANTSPFSTFESKPLIPGKVVLVALDQHSGQVSEKLRTAVRAALAGSAASTPIEAPLTTSLAQDLINGYRAPNARDGETPWGAEFLLVAAGDYRELSGASQDYYEVSLTLSLELRAIRDQAVVVQQRQTTTGTDVSLDDALIMAAEAALRPMLPYLSPGDA